MINTRDFYINGAWVKPAVPHDFDVIDPATEEACAVISMGSKADVNKAVAAAKAAFPGWAATPLEQRLALMEKLDVIQNARNAEMGEAVSLELGAPIDFASGDQAGCGPWHMGGFLKAAREFHWETKFSDQEIIVREPDRKSVV